MIILAEAKQPQSEHARLGQDSRLTISATMSLAAAPAVAAEKAAAPVPAVSRKVNAPTGSTASATTGNGGAAPGASVSIGTKPTLIDVPPMHFLIMDAPRQSNLHVYIRDMAKHGVAHVVRVCEPTYHAGELQSAGMTLHEMEYKDGTSPPKELIQAWLELVERTFYGPPTTTTLTRPAVSNSVAPTTTLSVADTTTETATLSATTVATPSSSAVGNGTKTKSASTAIAVHCVAGLGRAPVMVAIALIEFAGMDPVEAVSLIRANRRGAINEKQLLYLEGYKKQYKRRGACKGAASTTCGCVIS
jgi:protein tyrosine phosphatase type IVA